MITNMFSRHAPFHPIFELWWHMPARSMRCFSGHAVFFGNLAECSSAEVCFDDYGRFIKNMRGCITFYAA